MALPLSEFVYTNEAYLAMEREAEERHEYIDGYIYEMAGESQEHGEISSNLSWIIGSQLRGTPCRARIKDTKVRSGPIPYTPQSRKGVFSYPDMLIVCGEMRFLDEYRDVLINPRVIFEILSKRTEEFDRELKFWRYQIWNPTLNDYLLISQTRPVIEHYIRQEDGGWSYYVYLGLESRLTIKSVDCSLHLSDVYDRVVFPPQNLELFSGTEDERL
ncbi:MAG: Uma2 family endonuclease [Acidobacteria bacterium]|nr:Uma2 family endonuclease [Acidobacteriota bacterium]